MTDRTELRLADGADGRDGEDHEGTPSQLSMTDRTGVSEAVEVREGMPKEAQS
jgi:hypothetical protein